MTTPLLPSKMPCRERGDYLKSLRRGRSRNQSHAIYKRYVKDVLPGQEGNAIGTPEAIKNWENGCGVRPDCLRHIEDYAASQEWFNRKQDEAILADGDWSFRRAKVDLHTTLGCADRICYTARQLQMESGSSELVIATTVMPLTLAPDAYVGKVLDSIFASPEELVQALKSLYMARKKAVCDGLLRKKRKVTTLFHLESTRRAMLASGACVEWIQFLSNLYTTQQLTLRAIECSLPDDHRGLLSFSMSRDWRGGALVAADQFVGDTKCCGLIAADSRSADFCTRFDLHETLSSSARTITPKDLAEHLGVQP